MNERSIKRFWNKVTVRGSDECWLWTACVNGGGYGVFSAWGERPKMVLAHRFSYFLATGTVPTVCRHTCDNPPCVNPAHLLDGTHKDNVFDKVRRGRINHRNTNKTHCPKGHPYDTENTGHSQGPISVVTGQHRLGRYCLTCKHEHNKRERNQRASAK